MTALEQEKRELQTRLQKTHKEQEVEKEILKADYEEKIKKYMMSNEILMEE